jgi:membrane fusion protein (multidrug efflux system)
VEIISGVVPGQRVVTQGIAQVRPGSRVRILNQDGAVPTSAASPANGLKDRS